MAVDDRAFDIFEADTRGPVSPTRTVMDVLHESAAQEAASDIDAAHDTKTVCDTELSCDTEVARDTKSNDENHVTDVAATSVPAATNEAIGKVREQLQVLEPCGPPPSSTPSLVATLPTDISADALVCTSVIAVSTSSNDSSASESVSSDDVATRDTSPAPSTSLTNHDVRSVQETAALEEAQSAHASDTTAQTEKPADSTASNESVMHGCDLPPQGRFLSLIMDDYTPRDLYPKEELPALMLKQDQVSNTLDRQTETKKISKKYGPSWEDYWVFLKMALIGYDMSREFKLGEVENLLDLMQSKDWFQSMDLSEMFRLSKQLEDTITLAQNGLLTKKDVDEYESAQPRLRKCIAFKREDEIFSEIENKDKIKDTVLPELAFLDKRLDRMKDTASRHRFARRTAAQYKAAQEYVQALIARGEKEIEVFNNSKSACFIGPIAVVEAKNPHCLENVSSESQKVYHSTAIQTRAIRTPDLHEEIYGYRQSDSERRADLRKVGQPEYVDPTELHYGEPFTKPNDHDSSTQIETCDSGFQTMDFEYCEANILKAKAKGAATATKINNICLLEEAPIKVYGEPSKEKIVHSQQVRSEVNVDIDGKVHFSGSFEPKIYNILYEDKEKEDEATCSIVFTNAAVAPTVFPPGTTTIVFDDHKEKIDVYCGSPLPGSSGKDQGSYPQHLDLGWPAYHYSINTATGSYSQNPVRDFGVSNRKRRNNNPPGNPRASSHNPATSSRNTTTVTQTPKAHAIMKEPSAKNTESLKPTPKTAIPQETSSASQELLVKNRTTHDAKEQPSKSAQPTKEVAQAQKSHTPAQAQETRPSTDTQQPEVTPHEFQTPVQASKLQQDKAGSNKRRREDDKNTDEGYNSISPESRKRQKLAEVPSTPTVKKTEPLPSQTSSNKRKRDEPAAQDGATEKREVKRIRLPPVESTLRIIRPTMVPPAPQPPSIQRTPETPKKDANTKPAQTQQQSSPATPAPAGRAARKPTANRSQVRDGWSPYIAHRGVSRRGRRH